MQTVKETAANIAASARAGMEKTKANVQEKVERMKTRDPMEKELATDKKEGKKAEAELSKQEARENNAAAKQATAVGGHNPGYTATATYSTTGEQGRPKGAHKMSALPGHATGQPAGQVTEEVASSHPVGVSIGTGHTTAHNTGGEGGGGATGYGTGGAYS